MDYNQPNVFIDPRLAQRKNKNMSVPESLNGLAGCWEGTNRLWLAPDDPVRESKTTATIELIAQNRFAALKYSWAEGGKPQDGLILLGVVDNPGATEAVWVDSWHMGDQYMACQGSADADRISIRGSYAAPPGPDWGWRIELLYGSAEMFSMLMYNITPGEEEFLAVQADYRRVTADHC